MRFFYYQSLKVATLFYCRALLSVLMLSYLASCAISPSNEQALTPEQIKQLGDLRAPPTANQAQLTPVNWSDLPNWEDDSLETIWPALLYSCLALSKKTTWEKVCTKANQLHSPNSKQLKHYFEKYFTPYAVSNELGQVNGVMTGYYEPLLYGSLTRHGIYQTPLYAFPETIAANLRNLPRAELLKQPWLADYVLVWINNPVEAAFLQIQGSGVVQLDNGQLLRLGYAGSNDQNFKSFSVYMLREGLIKPNQASLTGIKIWAQANPDKIEAILNVNPRYIFFRELPSDPKNLTLGPIGSLGVPLSAERSIAIDPLFIQLGAPVYLAATYPLSTAFLNRLTLAQDTGNAIKNAIRADFFWGRGQYAAEQASKTKQDLKLWVLLPKSN